MKTPIYHKSLIFYYPKSGLGLSHIAINQVAPVLHIVHLFSTICWWLHIAAFLWTLWIVHPSRSRSISTSTLSWQHFYGIYFWHFM